MTIAKSLLDGAVFGSIFLFRDVFLGFTWNCKESPLQKKVDLLAKQMEVDVPIRTLEKDSWAWYAHGCSLYGKAAITVPSLQFGTKFKDSEVTAVLAHEIAHIKHNDAFWFGLLVTVTVVAFSIISSWILAPLLPFVVNSLILNGCVLWVIHLRSVSQENQADDEALQYLNNQQKRAFIHFFEKVRKQNLMLRNSINTGTWYGKILNGFVRLIINSNGEDLRARFTHPTLESRIAKVQKSIQEEPSWSWLPWKWRASRAA